MICFLLVKKTNQEFFLALWYNRQMPKKLKTEWDLKLLYKSPKDPQIEKDMREIEMLCENFEKKYSSAKDYLSDEAGLSTALVEYEKVIEVLGGYKPAAFFHYLRDLNSEDKFAEAQSIMLSERFSKASNRIIFFELAIGKIPKEMQERFLKSTKLEGLEYFLERIWERSKHDLTGPEEKILSLKSLPSYSLWIDGNEKALNKQTILWKKKQIPLSLVSNLISSLPTKERHQLHRLFMQKLKATSDFAEAEVNAIVIDKKIEDELRGYEKPYDSTLLSYQTDNKTVDALRKAVTDNFSVSHRFYKLKAKLLGEKRLEYADRAAPIGKIEKKISFNDGFETLKEVFSTLGKRHADTLQSYAERGQIDVFPKKGKTSGAYCSSAINLPTFVLLNDAGNEDSISTFAHEMGHAMHSEFTGKQRVFYRNYSTAVAETASTLYEAFLFDHQFAKMSDKEKIIALHKRINGDIQTVFRQIAVFNFEEDLHAGIRAKGNLPKEEIAELMNKRMKEYLGPLFDFREEDGYFFVTWSHIRRFFYVYSYAYGLLVSKALHRKYKKDKSFMKEIEKFMEAGSSKSPHEIFLDIGVDTSKPEFWQEGIDAIAEDISTLEKLIGKKK